MHLAPVKGVKQLQDSTVIGSVADISRKRRRRCPSKRSESLVTFERRFSDTQSLHAVSLPEEH